MACACGFEREASSAWAATAIARQHAQLLLDSPGSDHEIIVEEPPVDSAGPKPGPDLAARRVRDKLWNRILPNAAPVKTWAAYGAGCSCDGCEIPIAEKEVERVVELGDGRRLRFHVLCGTLWHVLRMALPTSDPG